MVLSADGGEPIAGGRGAGREGAGVHGEDARAAERPGGRSPDGSLGEVAAVFLKLGLVGFGGRPPTWR
jgi:hypothetical protein